MKKLFVCLMVLMVHTLHAQTSGRGLAFDGQNDFLYSTNQFPLSGNVSRTFSVYAKAEPKSSGGSVLFSTGDLQIGKLFGLYIYNSELYFYCFADFNTGYVVDGLWHQYTVTFYANTVRVYVDAVETPTSGVSLNLQTNPGNLLIGNDYNGNAFKGTMDEFRVWNRALCQDEIVNNLNCELVPANQTGLIVYYKMNQGVADGNNAGVNTITDESGTGFNSSLENFALTGTTSNWTVGTVSNTSCNAFAIVGVTSVTAAENPVCPGATTTLTANVAPGTGTVTWWSGANGSGTNLGTGTTLSNVPAGTYYARTSNCNEKSITVTSKPGLTVSNNGPVVLGTTLQLSVTGGTTYSWTGPTSFSSTDPNPVRNNFTYEDAGVYTVNSFNNGCSLIATTLVQVSYCAASATNQFVKVSNVTLGSINNTSSSLAGYANFISLSTVLVKGSTYNMSVSTTDLEYSRIFIVFIDFNRDGDFTDQGEQVYSTSQHASSPRNFSINVPSGALTGATRLRIRLYSTNNGANSSSCGNSGVGEVEDYTVILAEPPCTPTLWYKDFDSDGYGDKTQSTSSCTQPAGYVSNDDDCDDSHNASYPGAAEVCDGLDNDCNGTVDDGAGTCLNITTQPQATQTICKATAATALSVTATGNALTYQWYYKTGLSVSGKPVAGATSASYSPSTGIVRTIYYYCIVSSGSSTVQSSLAELIIEDCTPAGALNFDGVNDYVYSNNPAPVSGAAPRTVELWAKLDPTAPSSVNLFTWGGYNFEGNTFGLLAHSGNLTFVGWSAADFQTGYIIDNNWHHYAISYDGTTVKVYVDGGLVASQQRVLDTYGGNQVSIGRWPNGNLKFKGDIDEFRIWNRALCQSEIAARMNCNPGKGAGLVLYYKFNHGFVNKNNSAFTTAVDASVNGNTAILQNFALTGTTSNWTAGIVSNTTCAVFTSPTITNVTAGKNPVCAGTTTILTANGVTGEGAVVNWYTQPGGAGIFKGTGAGITVAQGKFFARVTGSCGAAEKFITITKVPIPVAGYTSTPVSCYNANDATITASATGGTTPYEFRVNSGVYKSSDTFNSIKPGSYRVYAKDANGCTGGTGLFTITQPVRVAAVYTVAAANCGTATGSIRITATAGVSTYQYRRGTNVNTTGVFNNLKAGMQYIYVIDANGCSRSYSITVADSNCIGSKIQPVANVEKLGELNVSLSPNPAASTQFMLRVQSSNQERVQVSVFDLNGKTLYRTAGSAKQLYRFGQELAPGMYIVEVRQGKEVKKLKAVKLR